MEFEVALQSKQSMCVPVLWEFCERPGFEVT